MKYDAVIFDLFGTLVPTPAEDTYTADHRRTAEILGVELEAYLRVWYDEVMSVERASGVFPDVRSAMKAVCEQLNISVTPETLADWEKRRIAVTRKALRPRSDALDTLHRLLARGVRLGMMSDCTHEVPIVWDQTELAPCFDEAMFSCSLQMKKPDPRFYKLMCEKLMVDPERCMYVGDGSASELTGARNVGMEPVLICPPAEAKIILARDETNQWTGPRIAGLSEILDLIG